MYVCVCACKLVLVFCQNDQEISAEYSNFNLNKYQSFSTKYVKNPPIFKALTFKKIFLFPLKFIPLLFQFLTTNDVSSKF